MNVNSSLRPTRLKTSRLSGFSRLQTAVATSIAAAVLLTVAALFSSGNFAIHDDAQANAATSLAKRLAEQIRLDIESKPQAPSPAATTKGGDDPASPAELTHELPLSVYTASLDLHPSFKDRLSTATPAYATGFTEPDATYLATWQTSIRDDLTSGSQILLVTVEVPASAPAGDRKVYRYTTLVQSAASK